MKEKLLKLIEEFDTRKYSSVLFKKEFHKNKSCLKLKFHGFNDLRQKIQLEEDNDNINEYFNQASKVFNDFRKYNKKLVALYEVPNSSISDLKKLLNTLPTNNASYKKYLKAYPISIDQDILQKLPKDDHILSLFVEDQPISKVLEVTLVSRSYLRIKDELSQKDLATDILNKYQEIIGYKDGYIQSYDLIRFNYETGILEIFIDMAPNISRTDCLQQLTHILTLFIKAPYQKKYGSKLQLFEHNIFEMLNKLYTIEETDGLVYALSHLVPGNAIKEERMSQKTEDLRKEDFHNGGIKAVEEEQSIRKIYKIHKVYLRESGKLSLEIIGSQGLVLQNSPKINYAIFHDCISMSDVIFLLQKLND